MSPSRDPHDDGVKGGRPEGLGALLVEARRAKGLELADIAELTHVRQEYLRALEEGRFQDLPEDVYCRNYVRLYAQAVSLDAAKALEVYSRERRQASGMSTLELRLEQERRGEVPLQDRRRSLPFGTLLPTLLLVAVLVALAVWGFNSLLFKPVVTPASSAASSATLPATAGAGSTSGASAAGGSTSGPSTASPANVTAPSAPAPAGVVGDVVQARTVQVSITTTPPGASVSIDGFALPGTTPIADAPVTAREGRVVKIALAGFETLETKVDLRQDRSLSYSLTPVPQAAATAPATPERAVTPASVGAGQIGINITARTWLEVYHSTTRNQGERLVYATVDPGAHYLFDLPVYLHVGNAAGVDILVDGKDLGTMGSPGAVVSRAFPAP